ncbi:hypothetical protein ACR30T_01505 [Neisseria gonorrhoeae]
MTAAPRQIQTHHARIPRPLHQHQPDRRKRHPHNRPRPWHISRAALQRAGFSSLHHYLTADSYRLQERRELAEWYCRRHRQAYEAAAQNTCNKT